MEAHRAGVQMKPLSEMTREELWSLEEYDIAELCKTSGVEVLLTSQNPISKMNSYKFRGWGCILADLEHLRLELQDKAAK